MRRSKIALRCTSPRRKSSALRTEEYFRERGGRANLNRTKRILKRAGRGKPPLVGDEL